jgi:hypothetical protein
LALGLRELQRAGGELEGVEGHLQGDDVRGVPDDRADEGDDDVQRDVRVRTLLQSVHVAAHSEE